MNLKRKQLVWIGIVVSVGMIVLWEFVAKPASASNQGIDPVKGAPIVVVARSPIENVMTLSGEFRPYQQVDVHAKVAGYIKRIYVDVGDHVTAGQVLAVLEVPELNAQVAGAKADIHRDQDAIRRAESEIKRAESTHSAYHAAYTRLKQASAARPGLIAEQELDDSQAKDQEAEAQIESARAALSESQSQLVVAEADLDRLSALEDYSRITAPFTGVVTKRYADTGALIQAGTASSTQSMPVVQLAEWSRLRLVVPVPESAVPFMQIGNEIQVHVAALQRDFNGRISRFADSLSDETRTMHTEIDVENPDQTLKEGMYAEVRLTVLRKQNALTVPVQALQGGDQRYVLALDDQNRVHKQEVEIGEQDSTRVEILRGLVDQELVISANQSSFQPGEIVKPRLVADMPAGKQDYMGGEK